jgi:hypothetical protein
MVVIADIQGLLYRWCSVWQSCVVCTLLGCENECFVERRLQVGLLESDVSETPEADITCPAKHDHETSWIRHLVFQYE